MRNHKSKILIVEDEPIIATDLEMTIEGLNYEVTGVVDNAEDALASLEENMPDLVLLDINIEGDTDGVMLAEEINRRYKIPFVFLTSNADGVTINRVKRTKPAGFIVKPFSEKDLKSNIEIALFTSVEEPEIKDDSVSDIFVKEGSSMVKIRMKDLMFAKAEDNYTRLFTTNKNHIISSTLKKVLEKLPSGNFIRIHRTYVVNTRFIDKIKDGYLYIEKHQLPIGRSYYNPLFERINKF